MPPQCLSSEERPFGAEMAISGPFEPDPFYNFPLKSTACITFKRYYGHYRSIGYRESGA
mgnify:CR=1